MTALRGDGRQGGWVDDDGCPYRSRAASEQLLRADGGRGSPGPVEAELG